MKNHRYIHGVYDDSRVEELLIEISNIAVDLSPGKEKIGLLPKSIPGEGFPRMREKSKTKPMMEMRDKN